MAEVTIPKEKMNYTIDLLITMVTDEIAEETGKDRNEVLTDFLCSKTGKALYDEKTKLWCTGPAYIAELYMEELKKSLSKIFSLCTFGKIWLFYFTITSMIENKSIF